MNDLYYPSLQIISSNLIRFRYFRDYEAHKLIIVINIHNPQHWYHRHRYRNCVARQDSATEQSLQRQKRAGEEGPLLYSTGSTAGV